METIPDNNKGPNLQQIAEKLNALQATANGGRGIECVRWLVEDLQNGDLENARVNAAQQYDKIESHPQIKQLLIDYGIINK